MIQKYQLVLNLGEVSMRRRIPTFIYDVVKKYQKVEKWFENDKYKIQGDYYLIQAMVKEILKYVLEYRKFRSPLPEVFDDITGKTNLDQIVAICNEDWSLEMRQRWDKMQPMMSDTLFNLRAYDKVYAFIHAMYHKNTPVFVELDEEQINNLIEMGKYVFENYQDVKYGEVFEKFEATSRLEFPTSISW